MVRRYNGPTHHQTDPSPPAPVNTGRRDRYIPACRSIQGAPDPKGHPRRATDALGAHCKPPEGPARGFCEAQRKRP